MSFDMELSAALEAAERAADLIRREYESFVAIPDAPVSISTHVDKASQDLILKFLHEQVPRRRALCRGIDPGFRARCRRAGGARGSSIRSTAHAGSPRRSASSR